MQTNKQFFIKLRRYIKYNEQYFNSFLTEVINMNNNIIIYCLIIYQITNYKLKINKTYN